MLPTVPANGIDSPIVPMKDWLSDLAHVANFVVAVGDCACWGGIPAMAPNPTDSSGLQYLKREEGGFLGKDFRSKSGLPVINIPGCPAYTDTSSGITSIQAFNIFLKS